MTLQESKEKFIQAWGTLGSHWGISRTMAQVHALLLVSGEPICVKEIMENLKISIGNANMNLRALMDWGLVHKVLVHGDRKEYFTAEKDMSKVIKQIILQRKKKELEPMIKALEDIGDVEAEGKDAEEFSKVIGDLRLFSNKADAALENLVRLESSWFMNVFMTMIK